MTSGHIRLSRISYPRGTWWVMLLIAAVFLAFGAWAQVWVPEADQVLSHPNLEHSQGWIAQAIAHVIVR